MNVQEVMTRDVITMTPKTTIIQAIDLLIDNRISGAPVLKEDGTMAGIISEKDLMVPLDFFGKKKTGDDCVGEFMAKNVTTFSEDASIEEVMETLVTQGIKRVPIVKDNKVVGIVSRRDILKYIRKNHS